MSATLELSCELIRRPSVTPDDAGCQTLIAERLTQAGFACEIITIGEVDNLWAVHGQTGPLTVLLGHTDVVPTGPVEDWGTPPFEPTLQAGVLYGRGAADMKGSVAAMVVALEQFVSANPNHNGRIALLLTSDEEGDGIGGIADIIPLLTERGEQIDYCLVGEPSSTKTVGDVIKNGRRGSLGAKLVIRGKQGHVAYPHLADNPIHRAAPALAELASIQWDHGNNHFPPTSFQISNIHSGTGVTNVIPGEVELLCNWRFSTELAAEAIQQQATAVLDKHQLDYEINWRLSGLPFLTPAGKLVDAACNAVEQVMGFRPTLSTAGGTSDGRFVAPTGAEVLELGPVNATIHQVNECVEVAALDQLTTMYEHILRDLTQA